MIRGSALRVALSSACLLACAAVLQAQPFADGNLSPTVQKPQSAAALKLEPALAVLADEHASAPDADVAVRVPLSVGDAVAVTIRFDPSRADQVRTDLAALGVQPANEAGGEIEAYIPVSRLTQAAALDSIDTVTLIVPPVPAAVVSQGAIVHNALTWQAAGRSGTGVKVGVIDVGFQGIVALSGTELPAVITARCYTGVGAYVSTLATCDGPISTSPHGTAVAEALLDVAPGVQLFVANPQTPLDLQDTVQWMLSLGVKVINHSVTWTWDGPGDGTSPYPSSALFAVDAAVAGGAFWTNAAGDTAQATWTGPFRDVNSNGYVEFTPGVDTNAVYLEAGRSYVAQLRWEDSWLAASRDLDLYLFSSPTLSPITRVALSAGFQAGSAGQTPYERIAYTPTVSGYYYLAIQRYRGGLPGWIELQSFTAEPLQYPTVASSITNPAVSSNAGMMAVGAAPWFSTSVIELFSSQGPTRDGRVKPDIVAADRGDSASVGTFGGTSQASAHVAGLAALMIGSFPSTPPAVLAAYLRTLALPRTSANAWGAGFAQVPVFPGVLSLSALLPDRPLPVPVGQPVTWRAFGIGTATPFEYQFWVFREGVGWTISQPYSPSNTFVWTPPAVGNYSVQAWMRRVGSVAAYEDWRGVGPFAATAPSPAVIASVASNAVGSVQWGTPLYWSVAASGGIAPLQYRFWRLKQGLGWTIEQDYGPSNTFTWTPGPSDGGVYTIQVWVRSAGSAAPYEAWQSSGELTVIPAPPITVTVGSSVTFPVPQYTPITWTASASGGPGAAFLYQFWRFKLGVGWTIVQDYSASSTYSWTPGASDLGSYSLQVWVKTALSSAAYDGYVSVPAFDVIPAVPVQIVNILPSVTLPMIAGTPVTFTVTTSGGTPPLSYRFFLLNTGTGVWSLLRDYAPSNTAGWISTPGNFILQVWVRSATSSAAYDDFQNLSFTVLAVSPPRGVTK